MKKFIISVILILIIMNCFSKFSGNMFSDRDINSKAPEIISDKIKNRTFAVNEIYEKYRKIDQNLKGQMFIKMIILPEGKVTGVYIDSTDITNMLFKPEVINLIQKWQFTGFYFKGNSIAVNYNFKFAPAENRQ